MWGPAHAHAALCHPCQYCGQRHYSPADDAVLAAVLEGEAGAEAAARLLRAKMRVLQVCGRGGWLCGWELMVGVRPSSVALCCMHACNVTQQEEMESAAVELRARDERIADLESRHATNSLNAQLHIYLGPDHIT